MDRFSKRREKWLGFINSFKKYKNHYEIFIESCSSIMLIFGETSRDKFVYVPDFGTGCRLVD